LSAVRTAQLRVRGIRDGRAEGRLDPVADELQHEPAVLADGPIHFREVGVQVADHLARARRRHPGREVAEVREENGDLLRLPLEGHPPGQDLVADLAAHVLPEGLLQELVLLEAGRPVLASVAYSLTVFVMVSATLARMPAFAESLPSVPETALAAALTVLAGFAGGVLARGAVEQLERVLVRD
jgi:hypothetical protein